MVSWITTEYFNVYNFFSSCDRTRNANDK